jgi:DNA primase large subunit
VSDTDKETLRDKLESVPPKYHKDRKEKKEFQDETYFEVDFERVTELVGRRQVYIQGGKAYVPMRDQVDLVLDQFKEKLAHALEVIVNGSAFFFII